MPEMTQITPFLYCSNLDAQIAFFRDMLGFKVGSEMRDPDYAYLYRDAVAVRIIVTGTPEYLLEPAANQMVYIDVDDVEGLYSELEPQLSKLPEGRVTAPFDRFYGQREFHVRDEGPYLIMFGQNTSATQ